MGPAGSRARRGPAGALTSPHLTSPHLTRPLMASIDMVLGRCFRSDMMYTRFRRSLRFTYV